MLMPEFAEYLEHRYQVAANRESRKWFNESKLLALWGLWLLPWTRQLKDGDDCSFDAFKHHRKKAATWGQLLGIAGTSTQRLTGYKYVIRIRRGQYRISPKGMRCAYEYAIRALRNRSDEQPGDLHLQDFCNYYEVDDLEQAWLDGLPSTE